MPGRRDLGDLARRARDGDRHALCLLVERTERYVVAVARRRGLQDADARDVAADTYVSLLGNVGGLRDPDLVLSWLASTAERIADRRRAGERRRRKLVEALSALVPTWADPRRRSTEPVLRLSALPEDCREVARLHYVEGVPLGEVSRLLGLRGSQAKELLRKARGVLRWQADRAGWPPANGGRGARAGRRGREWAGRGNSERVSGAGGPAAGDHAAALLEAARAVMGWLAAGAPFGAGPAERTSLAWALCEASGALHAALRASDLSGLARHEPVAVARGLDRLRAAARAISAIARGIGRGDEAESLARAIQAVGACLLGAGPSAVAQGGALDDRMRVPFDRVARARVAAAAGLLRVAGERCAVNARGLAAAVPAAGLAARAGR